MTAVLRLLSRRGEPSRRTRRAIVVLATLVTPLTGVVTQMRELGVPRDVGWIVFAAVLVVVGTPLLVLQEFRRNVIRRASTDERERQRRNEAYRISYRIVELAIPLGVVAALLLEWALNPFPAPWMTLYLPIFMYVIFLPYAVFAWREPDAAD